MPKLIAATVLLVCFGLAACNQPPAPAATGASSSAPQAATSATAGGVGGATDTTKSGDVSHAGGTGDAAH